MDRTKETQELWRKLRVIEKTVDKSRDIQNLVNYDPSYSGTAIDAARKELSSAQSVLFDMMHSKMTGLPKLPHCMESTAMYLKANIEFLLAPNKATDVHWYDSLDEYMYVAGEYELYDGD
jgi:DNA relaxase NicK